jgi:hypothetical protein
MSPVRGKDSFDYGRARPELMKRIGEGFTHAVRLEALELLLCGAHKSMPSPPIRGAKVGFEKRLRALTLRRDIAHRRVCRRVKPIK